MTTAARRYDCFAIAAPGLESLVAQELSAVGESAVGGSLAGAAATTGGSMGISAVAAIPGGAEFTADAAGLAAALLRLRVASRVLVRLASFRATAFHELERAARQVEWSRVLRAGQAFRVRVTCRKSKLYHSDAVAERVAAAVVRTVPGAKLVDAGHGPDDSDDETDGADQPQLFVVRIDRDRCTISADASGELLHRRGYRLAVGRAPLRETLAAAMLLGTGWDPTTPLVDPLCGSGTIAIEAAMLARRIAPGLGRRFAVEHWPETPADAWKAARTAAESERLPRAPAPIIGADRDAGAIEAARANAARAGVAEDIEFRCAPISALAVPPGPGLLIANPPYGVRVGESDALRDLFARLGQVAREQCDGWRVALLSADRSLDAQTALPFADRFATNNGGIPVRLVLATVGGPRPSTARGH